MGGGRERGGGGGKKGENENWGQGERGGGGGGERGREKGKTCERRMIQVHKYSKKDYQYFPSYSFKNSYQN